jgi:hypothetical protein
MFNLSQIMQIIGEFQKGLQENLCQLQLLVKYATLEHGQIPDNFQKRSANKLQYVKEDTVTVNTSVKVREGGGYYPRDGYIANLGENPFQVILVGENNQRTSKFTISPNVAYAIRSPIEQIEILPVASLPAFYQVSVV